MKKIVGLVLVVWLVIGIAAAFQRGYLTGAEETNCKQASDTALTVVAGPLNYLGVNPKVSCPDVEVPEPSE